MAQAFTPRFVDLVRNTTTTVGTDDFVLGPAAAGFTSFAAAIQPGESFYYSCIGVAKPAETEVGRGTMQADGTISRDPIDGTLTDFTPGPKTVSLIAAAEWFTKVDQAGAGGGGSPPIDVASRAALAALDGRAGSVRLLAEPGREGLFTFDGSNLSAMVAADTAQGVYVPPASDRSGASGAWVRKAALGGPILFDWFGAIPGDYVSGAGADCIPAWNALQAYLIATRRNGLLSGMAGAPQVLFPGAQYYFSDTIKVKVTARLTGMGVGHEGGWPTTLRFAADKAGIIVDEAYTDGNVQRSPAGTAGNGTIIEGFNLVGGGTISGTLANDLLYSGIRLRTRAIVRDCRVVVFRGAGICISAAVGDGSDPFHGNCNNWRVDNVRLQANKCGGLFVSGGDANAGVATLVDATGNGRFGIYDGAFLGNTYVACHTDTNGLKSAHGLMQTGTVSHGGNLYFLRTGVSHATAIATTPGTNDAVWRFISAGAPSTNYPAWSATPGDTYVPSGSFGHDGSANACVFNGCYFETNQPAPQIGAAAIVLGGFMGNGQKDGATFLQSSGAGLRINRPLCLNGAHASVPYVRWGSDPSGQNLYAIQWGSNAATPSNPGQASYFYNDGATGDFVWSSYGLRTPLRFTGASTARTYGRTGTFDNRFITEVDQLALGNGVDAGNACRVVVMGTAPPAAGAHAQGEIVFNSAPSAGGAPGWVCVAAGSPGTWKAMASLAA